ncbi:helix-turn-helix domain-containing protein [Patulibacter defluvii]|uniref:helix-turn-helix domain-containing protein n=1 Tax=Patulibacter defluvii TaxID=3095358 RepID=UPI002A74C69B|nr:helix-turn-helix domain-containing protein [Patulibacter sp. DM4]
MAGRYRELPPPAALADRVACLWWRDPGPAAAGEEDRVVVLPDGCIDLVWSGGVLLVAGPDTGPSPVAPSAEVAVGLRFRPGAGPTVLGESALALRDRRVPVADLWGRAGRELQQRTAEAADVEARLALLVDAVRGRLAAGAGPADPAGDPLVAAAVSAIGDGGSAIGELAARLAISERQLRRRFHDHVGYGPKTLDRVLRLQRFLEAVAADDPAAPATLAALAAEAGYADQAHLARETRALTGDTASALAARWRTPG